MHLMILIKLLLVEECVGSALGILKKVMWGKRQLEICSGYQNIALFYIVQVEKLDRFTQTIEGILRMVEETKLQVELAFIEQIIQKLGK